MSKLAENTRYRMKALGLTQRELAQRANVSQVTISRIINGDIQNTSRIGDLAEALNTTVHSLLEGDARPKKVTFQELQIQANELRQLEQDTNLLRSLAERIAQKREALNLTQSQLGKKAGISQQAINQIEKGLTTNPRKIADIARALDTSVSWLLYGVEEVSNIESTNFKATNNKRPVISSVQAGQWSNSFDFYSNGDEVEWEQAPENSSDHSFWLRVVGDSMTSPAGLSIPEGMLILVDPEILPENGKLVVAKLDGTEEATFKRLVIDSGMKFLKPLNPAYPTIPINGNCRIVGVVTEAKVKL